MNVRRSENREIVGLVISEYGGNDLFIDVLLEYYRIYPDLFRWIENHWATSRRQIEIDVFSEDTKKIRRLELLGYTFQSLFENKRNYDLKQMDLNYTLEEGFTIRVFSEFLDYDGWIKLVQNAFENPGYSEKNLRGLMASPAYMTNTTFASCHPNKNRWPIVMGGMNRPKPGLTVSSR